MSTIAKKLKAIADSKEAIRKKLFISPEVPLSAYAELVPGSPAVVKPDQSTFDSALPFGRMKLLEASKEALRVGLGLPVAVPFSAYAEKVAAPAYAADFLTGNFRKNDVEVAFEEVAEFTRLSEATDIRKGILTNFLHDEIRITPNGVLLEPGGTNLSSVTLLAPTYISQGWLESDPVSSKVARVLSNVHPITTKGMTAVLYGPSTFYFHSDTASPEILIYLNGNSTYIPALREDSYIGRGINFNGNPNIFPRITGLNVGDDIRWLQIELSANPSSWIPTDTTPVTRAPDILRVPVSATQTLTYDADPSISMEMDGTTAVFTATEPGYIRSITLTEK